MTLGLVFRTLGLIACVFLCACSSGLYPVERHERWTAVAISTREVVSVAHPLHVGQVLYLETWAGKDRYRVTEIIDAEAGLFRALRDGDGVDLEPQAGDSGAPFRDVDGRLAALLIGRKR